MVSTKLPDDNGQVVAAHKVADISADGVVVLVHLIHMHTEHGVIQRIGICHLRCSVQHMLFPILPPAWRIHHQRVGETGVAQ